MTFAGSNWDSLDPSLVKYLESNQGTTIYLAATTTSSYASVLTLLTDQPVMALGGYQGWDRILDPTRLSALVQQGTIRFFLLPGRSDGRGFGANTQMDATADLTAWVQSSCSIVQSSGALQLYDCADAAT
jgi:4-amino-4-deoxy-L-arabinose transferase-like glycosyltransferase